MLSTRMQFVNGLQALGAANFPTQDISSTPAGAAVQSGGATAAPGAQSMSGTGGTQHSPTESSERASGSGLGSASQQTSPATSQSSPRGQENFGKSSGPYAAANPADSTTCSVCGAQFDNDAMLQCHVRQAHPEAAHPSQQETVELARVLATMNSAMGGAMAGNSSTGELQRHGGDTQPGSPSPGKQHKVFNPEAYCELCQKEFCNKYYLVTHKATKHGVGTVPSSVLASLPPAQQQLLMASLGTMLRPPAPPTGPQLAAQPDSAAEWSCHTCGQPFNDPFTLQTHMVTAHQPSSLAGGLFSSAADMSTSGGAPMYSTASPSFVAPGSHMLPASGGDGGGALNSITSTLAAPPTGPGQGQNGDAGIMPMNNTPLSSSLLCSMPPGALASLMSGANPLASVYAKLLGANANIGANANAQQQNNSNNMTNNMNNNNNNNNNLGAIGALGRGFGGPPGGVSALNMLDRFKLLATISQLRGATQLPNTSAFTSAQQTDAPSGMNVQPAALHQDANSEIGSSSEATGPPQAASLCEPDQQRTPTQLSAADGNNQSHPNLSAALNDGWQGLAAQQHQQQQLQLADMSAQHFAQSPSSGAHGQFNSEGVTPFGTPINKEAYCEFCNKEFCNKYFVRTHKRKKHGIFVDAPPPRKRPAANAASRTSAEGDDETNMSGMQGDPTCSDRSTVIMPSSPPNKLAKMTLPTMVSSGRAAGVGCAPGSKLSLDAIVSSLASSMATGAANAINSVAAPVKSEQGDSGGSSDATVGHNEMMQLSCDQCGRSDFGSAFSLAKHKLLEHGPNLEPKLEQTDAMTPTKFAPATPARCSICGTGCASKLQLLNHLKLAHGLNSPLHQVVASTAAGVPLDLSPQQQQQQSSVGVPLQATGVSMLPPQGSVFSLMNGDAVGGVSAPVRHNTGPGRPRFLPAKNFCDICQKEVCNKYFLRTHMLKMHGMVIDENKAIIGNVNTLEREKAGDIVFRCDICWKELRTRHSLREHKRDTHGIQPSHTADVAAATMSHAQHGAAAAVSLQRGGAAAGPGAMVAGDGQTQQRVCPVCDGTVPSGMQLWRHVRDEHANEVPPEAWISLKLAQDGQEAANMGTFACCMCGRWQKSARALQLHTLRRHGADLTPTRRNNNKRLGAIFHGGVLVKVSGSEPAAKLHRCTRCRSFVAPLDRLKRHVRVCGPRSMARPHRCARCGRGYASGAALQTHRAICRAPPARNAAHARWARRVRRSVQSVLGDMVDCVCASLADTN